MFQHPDNVPFAHSTTKQAANAIAMAGYMAVGVTQRPDGSEMRWFTRGPEDAPEYAMMFVDHRGGLSVFRLTILGTSDDLDRLLGALKGGTGETQKDLSG